MNNQRNLLLLFAVGIVGLLVLFSVALGTNRQDPKLLSTTARPLSSPPSSPLVESPDISPSPSVSQTSPVASASVRLISASPLASPTQSSTPRATIE